MDIVQAIKERKSIRAFKANSVPREIIERVLELAVYAPSAINLQPWEFIVVVDEEKERLSRTLLKAYREKQISCKPATVKPLPEDLRQRGIANTKAMEPYLEHTGLSFKQFTNEGSCDFYGAPVAILICIDDCFSRAHLVDIGIALGYLLLSAHDYGLATCPIGLIAAYQDEIREALNIPENKRVINGVALGYADRDNPLTDFKSAREDLDKLVRWV